MFMDEINQLRRMGFRAVSLTRIDVAFAPTHGADPSAFSHRRHLVADPPTSPESGDHHSWRTDGMESVVPRYQFGIPYRRRPLVST